MTLLRSAPEYREEAMLVTPSTVLRAVAKRRAERRGSPSVACRLSSAATTSTTTSSAPNSLLQLEYTGFYVSSEGVSRTLYRLSNSPFAVEEISDLSAATKTYVLRHTASDLAEMASRPCLATIHAQEIDHGISSFGTGAVTWEASIAATLYFAGNPVLRGDVLELGCGVGVAGTLNALVPFLLASSPNGCASDHYPNRRIRSMTLTDGEDEVIRHCRLNVARALAELPQQQAVPPVSVSRLDWNDWAASADKPDIHDKYHSVLACDCTYRFCDVPIICEAAVNLLHDDVSSQIHFFSPHNRGAAREVIRYLREQMNMHVTTEHFEAERCRLRPSHGFPNNSPSAWNELKLNQCSVIENTRAIFLHVVASRAFNVSPVRDDPLSDID
jgi:Lysine methyltransferase